MYLITNRDGLFSYFLGLGYNAKTQQNFDRITLQSINFWVPPTPPPSQTAQMKRRVPQKIKVTNIQPTELT